ncbi:WG repeat-containing protein [Leptospira sp. GIMC2001]|uniref:WG repeat-containing protein n=1 Tax=Leptospira sp. GIMC2001 TaxID=1513297 RepID=UPI00234BDA85|nr:WG repeat-containing protein [Leptospira sp. GIMC2001]WCL49110.1 WG repeat-containing protein [Leptospira sp. GIMC2001]
MHRKLFYLFPLLFVTYGCSTVQFVFGNIFHREIEAATIVVEASKIVFPSYPSATAYYGLISREGKIVENLSENWRDHFSEGLSASAKCDENNKNCKYGFQNDKFQWVIPPQWTYRPSAFQEGFAILYDPNTYSYKYIDKTGKFAFTDKKFLRAGKFNFGYARVALRMNGEAYDRTPKYEWAWLSKSGEILDFREPSILESSQNPKLTIREGMIPCPSLDEEKNIKWGYRNFKGEWVIPAKYFSVEPFYFGKAFVQTVESYKMIIDSQYILINAKGDNLFPNHTFRNIQAPIQNGLGILSFMPAPGESFGKSYLYNWRTNKKSEFSVVVSFRNLLWDDKWVPATEYKEYKGNKIGIGAYYDDNFRKVLDRIDGKYIFIDAESFSENVSYVRFYDPESEKSINYSAYIDRSGKILFYFDKEKLTYSKPYMKSGFLLISKAE